MTGHSVEGWGDLTHLFEDVVEARPLSGVFIPALVHQTETLSGSFIHWHLRSAEGRRVLQTIHDLCQEHRWAGRLKFGGFTDQSAESYLPSSLCSSPKLEPSLLGSTFCLDNRKVEPCQVQLLQSLVDHSRFCLTEQTMRRCWWNSAVTPQSFWILYSQAA